MHERYFNVKLRVGNTVPIYKTLPIGGAHLEMQCSESKDK